eukprot:gene33282-41069_t
MRDSQDPEAVTQYDAILQLFTSSPMMINMSELDFTEETNISVESLNLQDNDAGNSKAFNAAVKNGEGSIHSSADDHSLLSFDNLDNESFTRDTASAVVASTETKSCVSPCASFVPIVEKQSAESPVTSSPLHSTTIDMVLPIVVETSAPAVISDSDQLVVSDESSQSPLDADVDIAIAAPLVTQPAPTDTISTPPPHIITSPPNDDHQSDNDLDSLSDANSDDEADWLLLDAEYIAKNNETMKRLDVSTRVRSVPSAQPSQSHLAPPPVQAVDSVVKPQEDRPTCEWKCEHSVDFCIQHCESVG